MVKKKDAQEKVPILKNTLLTADTTGNVIQLSVPKRSFLVSVIFSLTVTVLSLLTVRFLPMYYHEETTSLVLFIAIFASLWYGGIIGGAVSLISSTIVTYFFLITPLHITTNPTKNIHILLFFLYGLGVLAIHGFSMYQRTRIRVSETNKAEILKSLPVGILIIGKENTVFDTNHEAEKLFGKSFHSLTSSKLEDLVKLSGELVINTKQEGVGLRRNREFPLEMMVTKPDFFEANGVRLAVIWDITEQKKYEQEQVKRLSEERAARLHAEEEVKAREEFLSIASHELKNPLTSMLLQIQGILHNMRNVSLADFSIDKMMRMLESSEQQSRRLNKMTSDLLNVSLITTGRLDLEVEKTDLTEIVKDVAMRFTEQFERAGCTFTLKAEKPIQAKVDKVRIEQVLTNLLSNAIKYGKGKPIFMKIEKADSKAIITVDDAGIGIPPENLERIFGRFERAVDKHEYKGLGVGLYIASQIIRAHHGVIKVKSEKGKGSSFIAELPL